MKLDSTSNDNIRFWRLWKESINKNGKSESVIRKKPTAVSYQKFKLDRDSHKILGSPGIAKLTKSHSGSYWAMHSIVVMVLTARSELRLFGCARSWPFGLSKWIKWEMSSTDTRLLCVINFDFVRCFRYVKFNIDQVGLRDGLSERGMFLITLLLFPKRGTVLLKVSPGHGLRVCLSDISLSCVDLQHRQRGQPYKPESSMQN